MAISEKLLEKINNLFKLAEGNTNENEAQTALLMAQKLMAQNGIEQAEIHQILKPKEILKEDITELGRLSWWEKSLAVVIAKNFRCEIYIHKSKYRGATIVFLGLKDDVQLAKIVYNFASDAIERDMKNFTWRYKQNHITAGSMAGIKNDYILGWIKGIESKYKEQVDQNGWGLVLVKDPLVQQEINKMHLRKGQSSAISRGHNDGAYSNGYQQGKSFNSPMGVLN